MLKGVSAVDIPAIKALVDRIWCAHVDAEPAGQYVGSIYAEGGLMRYLAKHFSKSSQRPPQEVPRRQRFNCSRGYFGECSRATAQAPGAKLAAAKARAAAG